MTDAFTPQHCYEMWKQIKSHPDCQTKQKNQRCVYAEVVREGLAEPYISICVKDQSDDCRVGFRGAEPWRITGYHLAGVGDPVVIRCGIIELRIERATYGVYGVRNNAANPYDTPTDIAIRIWWDQCLKVIVMIKNGQTYNTYYICP